MSSKVMATATTLVVELARLAIAAGFAGIGVLGVGLIAAAVWYPVGVLWGIVVVLLGLLGVCLAAGMAMTVRNQPAGNPA